MADTPGQPATPAPEPTPTATPAASPAPQPATPPATALTDPGDAKVTAPASWPDDWRQKIAGDDAKELKRLERMQSPLDVYKSFRELEAKFSKGETKIETPFPTEGTDEEKSAWRKERGIPVEGYKFEEVKLPDGLVVGDDDKPMVEDYLKYAHTNNLPKAVVDHNVGWYFQLREKQAQERAGKDDTDKTAARDALRDEMGKDMQRFLGAAYALVESAPGDVGKQILGARLANGKLLGNDADALRWLTKAALEINPAATVSTGTGAGGIASIQSRKAEIEKVMRDDRNGYFKDAAMQEEYRKLVDAENRVNKRSAA